MPLTVADTGEEYVIKRIGGKPEVKVYSISIISASAFRIDSS